MVIGWRGSRGSAGLMGGVPGVLLGLLFLGGRFEGRQYRTGHLHSQCWVSRSYRCDPGIRRLLRSGPGWGTALGSTGSGVLHLSPDQGLALVPREVPHEGVSRLTASF